MKDSWIVFCPAGEWQVQGINEAKTLGYKIVSIDSRNDALGFKFSDDYISINTDDHLNIIKSLKKKHINIVAAISYCSDIGIEVCASIRQSFYLKGYDKQIAKNLINKLNQRTLWERAELHTNFSWKSFDNTKTASDYLTKSTSKKIIKPVDSSGSRGVSVIEKKNENNLNYLNEAFSFSKSNTIIIEDYIEGKEYTIEAFFTKKSSTILAITEKNKLKSSNYTIAHEIFTPNISKSTRKKIKKLVEKAAYALGYFSGIAHIEIIIQKSGQIHLIEFSGRGGGFGLNHFFVEKVSGLNPTRLTLYNELGRKLNLNSNWDKKAFIKYIPAKCGTIDKIEYPKIDRDSDIEINFFGKEGTYYKGSKSDGDRVGYVFCVSDNLNKAKRKVYDYYNKINIKYL